MVVSWKLIICLVVALYVSAKTFKGSAVAVILGFLGTFALCVIGLNSLLAQF